MENASKPESKRPCLYCGGSQGNVEICLGCRSKMEALQRELDRAQKDRDIYRNKYWNLMRENTRRMKRGER